MCQRIKLSFPTMILVIAGCAFTWIGCDQTTGPPPVVTQLLPSGEEVIGKYLKHFRCRQARLKINAHLTEPDGSIRDLTIMNYQKCVDGTQYTIRQVVSPQSERSRALLSIERPGQPVENVAYLPGFDKFVDVQDMTREDSLFGLTVQESLGGYDLYSFNTLKVERVNQFDTYVVEGRLKPNAESRFARMVIYFRQDDGLPVRMELYNPQDELVRVRQYVAWTSIDGHWTERRTEVENLKHQKWIVFETVEADYNVNLPATFFSRDNLKALIVNRGS